jgi:DNA-binding MurR/RpiR family transcriptional regulator
MDSAQLQAMLREKMEQMPNKARRVVEYLLSNTREAAFLSIGEVAEKLDVSKASLSVFQGWSVSTGTPI